MNIAHGELINVYGKEHSLGDIGFVNAEVSLSGNGWSAECELREFPELTGWSAIQPLVEAGIDAIWVIDRLKAVFGSWIGLNEGEKSILNEGFVAHIKERDMCVPFVLHDYYLRTSFLFGATFADVELKQAIARSFYELLLADPYELIDFEFRKDHIGAGITMVGGIANGQVQYDEEQ